MAFQTITFTEQVQLVTMECGECHIVFAIPSDLRERAKVDSRVSFYCPNGHGRVFSRTRVQELEEQLRVKESEVRLANSARDTFRVKADKERKSRQRIEKRVANGVCPCCKRTFKQLAAHMHTKHPEYVEEQA